MPASQDTRRGTPGRGRRERPNPLGAAGGLIWAAIVVIPIYYVVITSVRRQEGFYADPQFLPPLDPTLEHYGLVLENSFFRYLANSLLVTSVTVAVTVFISLLAAYAMVRSQSRFVRSSFALILSGLAVPIHATIVPLFYMFTRTGIYDTYLAVILPSVGFSIAVTTLILTGFLRDIPGELFEAMSLDGASNWQVFRTLVLPLSRPAITTVGIFIALDVWNGFLFPFILTQTEERRVLPLSLWFFQGKFTVNVPGIMAAVVLATIPVVLLYVFARRQFVSGIMAGFSR